MGFLRNKGSLLLLAGLISMAPTLAKAQTNYHGRKAWKLENKAIQLLVLPGGGHIASLTLKSGTGKGVNPFTGEAMEIKARPATKKPRWSFPRSLKDTFANKRFW